LAKVALIKNNPAVIASEVLAAGPRSSARIFVVQRHLDAFPHYDFRISINGVLKSWAMPTGPSMNANDKRLAIMTEDKPMSYASTRRVNFSDGVFELWDKGYIVPHSVYSSGCSDEDLRCQIEEGRIRFTLKGKKLKGVFSMIRINGVDSKNWLHIKGNDKFAVDFNYNIDQFINTKSIIEKRIHSGRTK